MATTLYVNGVPVTLRGGSGGRTRIEDAINETLQVMGITMPCNHVRNLKGDRLKTSMAIPGETYIADLPDSRWQETLNIITGTKRRRSVDSRMTERTSNLPANVDLPPSVITNIAQLNDSELKPSIFGGCSGAALLKAKVVERHALDNLDWIKKELHNGIAFNKCAVKDSKITSRTLQSNETFTVFLVQGGRRVKKIPTSEITAIIKGKASVELENTCASISPCHCLVMQTNTRSLSLIFSCSAVRDRIASSLANLLGRECKGQDNVL